MNASMVSEKLTSGECTFGPKRKGRSVIWQIIRDVVNADGVLIPTFVCCEKCMKVLSYNGRQTTNLLRHKCLGNLTSAEIVKQQVSEETKSDFTNICTNWIIETGLPFSVVGTKSFQKLIDHVLDLGKKIPFVIDTDHLIPDATTVSRRVTKIAADEKTKLREDICEKVHIASATTDLWTDNYIRRNYITLTFHFLKNCNLEEITLGIKSMDFESSTGANILLKIKSLFSE